MKKYLLFFLVIVLFTTAIFNKLNNKEKVEQIEIPLIEVTNSEFQAYKKTYTKIVNEDTPSIALDKLRKEIKLDSKLLQVCHAIVHEIGHESYEKYKSFGESMKFQDEICNSGYIHGVIESTFSKSDNIITTMNTICSDYTVGKYLSWQCFHGIGHGLMIYTDNDLPESIKLCNTYSDRFMSDSCKNGVFMENFNVDQKVHISKYLNPYDIFSTCRDQDLNDKPICFIYSPTFYLNTNNHNYSSALKWCDTAPSLYKNACAYGVGSQAIKENIDNPKFVEKVCESGKKSQVQECINGMIDLYINHYGSLQPAKDLCLTLNKKNIKTCYDSIQFSSSLF